MTKVENCDENYDAYETEDCDMCDKCAFVVPVYEIATNVTRFPANKTELISYVHSNMSREFHKVRHLSDLVERMLRIRRQKLKFQGLSMRPVRSQVKTI